MTSSLIMLYLLLLIFLNVILLCTDNHKCLMQQEKGLADSTFSKLSVYSLAYFPKQAFCHCLLF